MHFSVCFFRYSRWKENLVHFAFFIDSRWTNAWNSSLTFTAASNVVTGFAKVSRFCESVLTVLSPAWLPLFQSLESVCFETFILPRDKINQFCLAVLVYFTTTYVKLITCVFPLPSAFLKATYINSLSILILHVPIHLDHIQNNLYWSVRNTHPKIAWCSPECTRKQIWYIEVSIKCTRKTVQTRSEIMTPNNNQKIISRTM